MSKRFFSILLAALLILSLSGCDVVKGILGNRPDPTPEPLPAYTPAPTPYPTYTPAPTPAPTPTPTPMPTPSPTPKPTPTPAPTPAPTPTGPAPVITKHPTSETHYARGSALFIANANGYSSLSWVAVAPNGTETDLNGFRNAFPTCTVTGDNDTSLTVGNLNTDMTGWKFYCSFVNNGAPANTNMASLTVLAGVQTQQNNPVVVNYVACPICGSSIPDSSAVCPVCGEYINAAGGQYYYELDENGNGIYADETGVVVQDGATGNRLIVGEDGSYVILDSSGNVIETGNLNG